MAHVKLPNGKDVTVKIEDLSPILDGDENYLHNQDLIELDTVPENITSIDDMEDTDSDIICIDESAPGHPTVKMDQNSPDLSISWASVTPEPQFFNTFDTTSTSTVKSAYSPPLTHSRAHMEDTVLRSGRVLLQR